MAAVVGQEAELSSACGASWFVAIPGEGLSKGVQPFLVVECSEVDRWNDEGTRSDLELERSASSKSAVTLCSTGRKGKRQPLVPWQCRCAVFVLEARDCQPKTTTSRASHDSITAILHYHDACQSCTHRGSPAECQYSPRPSMLSWTVPCCADPLRTTLGGWHNGRC